MRAPAGTIRGAPEAPISPTDVTTIMRLLSDIQLDVQRIRVILDDEAEEQDDDGEDDS